MVIRSGFVSSVAALRLAQPGISVTVLKRGRRRPTNPNSQPLPHVSGLNEHMICYGTLPQVVTPLARLPGNT